ncbi:hypothetical protein BH23GEM9_BH23GEM9_04120 [soil metagenome]
MTLRRICIVLGLLLYAAPALGQRVEVRGRGDIDTDAFLRRVVASGEYNIIARDTLIARADTLHGNALVLRATVRLDGVITGDLVIVDANVFLRPNSQVLGTIHNIAGGFYPSELADVGGVARSEPNAPYMVQATADGTLIILGTDRPSVITRPGILGFGVPTYDRVDGVTLTYRTGLLLPRMGRVEPELRGRIDYRSQRGAITGGLELGLPRGDTELLVGAERTTLTNERWIRGDLDNSISFLIQGKDLRDYYEADRAYVELRRILERGARTTSAFVRAQVEDARTLGAGSPWTVLGTPRDHNLAVDDGRISSAIGGARIDWTHPLHVFRIQASAEAAGQLFEAHHGFNAYQVASDWAMAALSNHTLRIQTHFQGPLPGSDSLPRQRWSFVGGSGTLYTFDVARFRGDRVAFVETQYTIPVPLRIRFAGAPDLDLVHLVGMAWTAQEPRPPFEQNIAVRLRFSLFNIRVLTNPAAFTDDIEFSAGLNLPRRSYPWTRERDGAR